jgi:protein-tyrosine-phosphatase
LPQGTGARRETWAVFDPFGEDEEVYLEVARELEVRIRALLSEELDGELFLS